MVGRATFYWLISSQDELDRVKNSLCYMIYQASTQCRRIFRIVSVFLIRPIIELFQSLYDLFGSSRSVYILLSSFDCSVLSNRNITVYSNNFYLNFTLSERWQIQLCKNPSSSYHPAIIFVIMKQYTNYKSHPTPTNSAKLQSLKLGKFRV